MLKEMNIFILNNTEYELNEDNAYFVKADQLEEYSNLNENKKDKVYKAKIVNIVEMRDGKPLKREHNNYEKETKRYRKIADEQKHVLFEIHNLISTGKLVFNGNTQDIVHTGNVLEKLEEHALS